jgi:hypothetical protein
LNTANCHGIIFACKGHCNDKAKCLMRIGASGIASD